MFSSVTMLGTFKDDVNDELAYYHGMSSDSTDSGRTGSVPLVFGGLSRDTFEDESINVGDKSRTEDEL
ncbi:hypothetical protein QYF36_010139 [Acer negundo]|nr:hypothetical protein QYF36_010139 [Acer negundo]